VQQRSGKQLAALYAVLKGKVSRFRTQHSDGTCVIFSRYI
jgi:hypothetical protein